MIRTFAKTLTDGELSEQGMELRIQHPRSPHTKPHPGGGHIVLMRYVADQAYLPVAVHGHHNQGCNTGCNTMQEHQFLGGGRLEAEVIHYKGYRADNDLVLVLDKRGLEGTVPKHWDCGTLVMQTATGADFQELYDMIMSVLCKGCLLAVPRLADCTIVKAGEWRCIDGCWRRALKDVTVTRKVDGTLNAPLAGEPATSDWSQCYGINSLLNLLLNNNTRSAANNPSAWVRVGTAPNQKQSGNKPPNTASNQLLAGGFRFDSAGNLIAPRPGIYDATFRIATIAAEQKLYQNPYKLKVQLVINGQVETQLIQDDYAGKTPGEELNDFRCPTLALNAGDAITVHTVDESAQNWLSAYDVKLVFISDLE